MRKTLWLMGAAALLIGTLAASAQPAVSDSLTVYGPTGKPLTGFPINLTETQEISGPGRIWVDFEPILANPAMFGHATQVVENGAGGPTSDYFGVVLENGQLVLGFSSDNETSPAALTDGLDPSITFGASTITLPEGNGVFNATAYLNPSLVQAGYTAQFISDVETVPDGGMSAGLLGLGLAGLVWMRRNVQ